MPTNLLSGNSAKLVVEFITVDGDLTQPTSASVTFTYFINAVSNSSTLELTREGSFWTCTWSSVGVDVPSDVTWVAAYSLSGIPAQVGTIRIIDP